MEHLLWLILLVRAIRGISPYLVGAAIGLTVLAFAGICLTPGPALILAAIVAIGVAHGIKEDRLEKNRDSMSRSGPAPRTDRRRRPPNVPMP